QVGEQRACALSVAAAGTPISPLHLTFALVRAHRPRVPENGSPRKTPAPNFQNSGKAPRALFDVEPNSAPWEPKFTRDLMPGAQETRISFNPTARRLALSVRPLQKPFACRDQFTATHQFDVGVYPRRDTERVRISVSAQHLPVIQPQCSAIK